MHQNPWAAGNWSASQEELSDPVLPPITLGVLNYNRCDDLARTLEVLTKGVQYPHYEVIVIDNGSSDGSVKMVRECFPSVILYEVGENIGTSARNHQTRLARGKYLFSFDDDSVPGSPAMILRIVQYMEAHPELDVLNGMCYQPRTGITETNGWERFRYGGTPDFGVEGIYLVEGGVCFRLDTLRLVEGYEPAFIYAAEGPDLALQLFKKSAKIVLCPWFLTLHFKSPVARSNQRAAYWSARHTVWMIAKHWPPYLVPLLLILFFCRRLLGAVLHPSTAISRAKGVKDGLKGIVPFLRYAPKLSTRQIVGLKRFYIQLYRW